MSSWNIQNDYDLAVDIVRNVTDGDPFADLSPDDISDLMHEAARMGYEIPTILTADLFLQIYNDLKPEVN